MSNRLVPKFNKNLISSKVMLNEFNAKNAQFRILPQYKVKSEGEVVCTHFFLYFTTKINEKRYKITVWSMYFISLKVQIYDQIVFESIKSPGHFFHASSPFQIDHSTYG